MLLTEILDMKPVKFRWISPLKAVFSVDEVLYGILLDELQLKLPDRNLVVVNISFGVVDSESFTEHDLRTNLTNAGKPRTVLSTVSEACLNNKKVIKSDVIALAAADQATSRRTVLYSLALQEISRKVPEFANAVDIQIKTINGSVISLLSKTEFRDDEVEILKRDLMIDKM